MAEGLTAREVYYGNPADEDHIPDRDEIVDYLIGRENTHEELASKQAADKAELLGLIDDFSIVTAPTPGALSTVYLGAAATPTTGGTQIDAGSLFLEVLSPGDGLVKEVQIVPLFTADVYVFCADVAGDTKTIAVGQIRGPFTLSAGLQTITETQLAGLTVRDGQALGLSGSVNGWASQKAGTTVRYWYSTTILTTAGTGFTDSTLSTSANEVMIRVKLDVAVLDHKSDAMWNGTQLPRRVGVAGAPVTGLDTAAGHWIDREILRDGRVTAWTGYCNVAADIVLALWRRTPAGLLRTRVLRAFRSTAGAINTQVLNARTRPGDMLGISSPTLGFISYLNQPGRGQFSGIFAALSGEVLADFAPAFSNDLQHAFTVEDAGAELPLHRFRVGECDSIAWLQDSFSGYYMVKGWTTTAMASAWTDYRIASIAVSGDKYSQQLDRLRANTVLYANANAPVMIGDLGAKFAFVTLGQNDYNGSPSVTFGDHKVDVDQMLQNLNGMGMAVTVFSPHFVTYAQSSKLVYKSIADRHGATFFDLQNHVRRVRAGTDYAGFFSDGSIKHHGSRTAWYLVEQYLRRFAQMPRPQKAIKAWRKRDSISVASLTGDLMFSRRYEMLRIFKEIDVAQVTLDPGDEIYLDELDTPGYGKANIVNCEYLAWVEGRRVSFTDYAMILAVVDTTAQGCHEFAIDIGRDDCDVYFRAVNGGAIPSDGEPMWKWEQVAGDDGVYRIWKPDIHRMMDFDTVHVLVVKSGAFDLADPEVSWRGHPGKPERATVNPMPFATGASLMTQEAFVSGLTGWTATGTITRDAATTYMFPLGDSAKITVDASNYVTQTLSFSPDSDKDRDIEIRPGGRWFPALNVSTDTYPDDFSIKPDECPFREMVVTLTMDSLAYDWRALVGPWWGDPVVRAFIPAGVSAATITVKGDDAPIEISRVKANFLN